MVALTPNKIRLIENKQQSLRLQLFLPCLKLEEDILRRLDSTVAIHINLRHRLQGNSESIDEGIFKASDKEGGDDVLFEFGEL